MSTERNSKGFIINYCLPYLLKKDFNYITRVILHEFGHIKHPNLITQINKEIFAEKFMLKTTKKYYPKLYKEAIKEGKECLNNKKWIKKFPIHYKAFLKLEEYNNGGIK